MAQINLRNPVLLSARRGRSTTALVVRGECGSIINLTFTSFRTLTALETDLQHAVSSSLPAEGSGEWVNPDPAAHHPNPYHRRRASTEDRRVASLLSRLGLLDLPFWPRF
jgi:hypothetical protein